MDTEIANRIEILTSQIIQVIKEYRQGIIPENKLDSIIGLINLNAGMINDIIEEVTNE